MPDNLQPQYERSDFLKEVLGKTPPFLIRSGTVLIFLFLIVLLIIFYLIKYPDIVVGRAILTTENPPIRVISKKNGLLQSLFVEDKKIVKKDEILGVIENTADLKDIKFLKAIFKDIKTGKIEMDKEILPYLSLGEIQEEYIDYQQKLKEYKFFDKRNLVKVRISHLENQISQLVKLNQSLKKQGQILKKQLNFLEKELKRNDRLLSEGVISQQEKEKTNIRFLEQEQQYEALTAEIFTNNVSIEELKASIVQLKNNQIRKKEIQLISIKEKIEKVLLAIEDWEYLHLLKAPINGQISMNKIWSEHQFIRENEEVFVIVPDGERTNLIITKMEVNGNNFGKIKIGQRVIIKLDSYQYNEYGALEGSVKNISLTPKSQIYTIDIALPNGLNTSFNKTISFNQEMQGSAEIITEDLRFIERIFYQFRGLFFDSAK